MQQFKTQQAQNMDLQWLQNVQRWRGRIQYSFKNKWLHETLQYSKMKNTNFEQQKYKQVYQLSQKGYIRRATKEQVFNQLKICRPFPKSPNYSLEVTVVSLGIFHLIITFAAFKVLTNQPLLYSLDFIQFQQIVQSNLFSILFVVCILLKLIVVTSIVLDHSFYRKKDGQKIIFQIAQYLRKYQRVAVELDFTLSAILLISTFIISILNFLGSVLIICFSVICLENYSVKKNTFYIGSIKMHIFLRMSTVIGSIATFLCLRLSQNHFSVPFFIIIHSFAALLITSTYFSKGYMIYRANIPKWGLFLYILFLNSLLFNMWTEILFRSETKTIFLSFFLTALSIGSYFHLRLKRKLMQNIPNQDIEVESNHLLGLLQQSHLSAEAIAFMVGIIKFHVIQGCLNPNCYANNPKLYDSKAKLDCETGLYCKNKVFLLKSYLKCRYETHLEKYPKDFETMLLYSEFIYNSFKNLGLSLYWLEKLNSNRNHLSLFIKIKLNALIAQIKQDNNLFVKQIYANNLKIEELIEAEEVHSQITAETQRLLFEEMSLWQMLEHQEVDVSLLRRLSQQIFSRINQNSKRWKTISDYVQQSDQWRSHYIFFAMFLKNQRLKNRVLEKLDISNGYHHDKEKKAQIISNMDLFDRNSCCLHTQIQDGEILIKRVSKHFLEITGYEANEVLMSNLKMIMPQSIAKAHHDMIMQMSASGKFYDEKAYSTNKVYIVNKEGFIMPVLKIYKEFVTSEGKLEYVCFLKKIIQKQFVVLCDSNFQVQGITKETIDCITDDLAGARFIECVNLISLIPELAPFSKFESDTRLSEDKKLPPQNINAKNEVFYNQGSSPMFHWKSTNTISLKCQLIYPQSNFEEYAKIYQNSKDKIRSGDTKRHYESIRQLSEKMAQGEHQNFACDLLLRQIKNDTINFFEVKLERLRSNRPNQLNSSLLTKQQQQLDFQLPVNTPNNKGQNFAHEKFNIFIKEEYNQAKKSNKYLKYARTIWVLFFIVFSIVYTSRIVLLYSSYDHINKYVRNQDSTVQASILSSRLANEHQLLLMNISLAEDEDSSIEIQDLTEELKRVINSVTMKQVIFEKSLSTHSHYPTRLPIQDAFDEIDFFYFMEGLIQTLSSSHQMEPQAQRHTQSTYIDYIFPSFSNCLNQTINKIASRLEREQASMQKDSVAFILLETLIILLSLVLIICITYRFFTSMIEMLKIHCNFSPSDTKKVRTYLTNIYNIFRNMKIGETGAQQREDDMQNIQKVSTRKFKRSYANSNVSKQQIGSPQSINLNKKTKKIRTGRHIKVTKSLQFVKIILTFVAITIAVFVTHSHLESLLTPIKQIKDAQSAHYRWIPTNYLTAHIVAYGYNPESIAQFSQQTYSLLLSNLDILRKIPYPDVHLQNANTVQGDVRDFYFGNTCSSLQAETDLGITVDQCLRIADSSFQNGIRGYSQFQYEIISKIMNEGFTPSLDMVKTYFRSVEVFHVLNSNLMNNLHQQYSKIVQQTKFELKIFTISMIVLLLVLIVFVREAICGYLQKEYKFHREFYGHMMPQFLISEDKIIKSKLTVINFL